MCEARMAKPTSFSDLCKNESDLIVCCNQALSQKEAEKAALIEKLANLQQDLATADMELEHTKREAHSKHEQDKVKNMTGS